MPRKCRNWFFNLKESKYGFIFAVMGLLASSLWFCVCLGGKFWQARWEQRLLEFEKELLPDLDFFAAGPERVRADVEKGLAFHKMGWSQRLIYRLVLNKPSVSYSMIRTFYSRVGRFHGFIHPVRENPDWLTLRPTGRCAIKPLSASGLHDM